MNKRSSSAAGLGVMAAVGLVVCCALPALIGAGALATVGTALCNPLLIAAGAVVLAGAVGYAFRRQRRGHICGPPTTETAAIERDQP
jgi:mercuric ion transport protein